MKQSVLTLWFVAAAVLIAANSYVCYVNVRKITENARLVSKARDTIFASDRLLSTLKDAETSERGFLITGLEEYLQPYERALANVTRQRAALQALVADQPAERERAASLEQAAAGRLAELRETIDVRRAEGFEAARRVVVNRGKSSMDEVLRIVEDVRQNQERALLRHSADREQSVRAATATLAGAGLFNLFLLGMIAYVVRRDAAARARATAETHRKLELERDNVRLEADVAERRQANDALTALTTRLEQSNRELQDFASVASHDLQEPLRKIQAFGDRLRTKFAQPLGADGRDYVDRMHSAASRMQSLINDLLSFSRVTTKAQPFAPVDLNGIVVEVMSDLEARVESSGGRVDVGPLPTIDADAVQMRQFFQNLIANALKFRKPEVAPVVSVTAAPVAADGSTNGAAAAEYEIRVADNGIGFDEKYLDRIFNVFQRLHGRTEYEGTGIGLAVCRKIVERHGGRITAQSREGAGAVFVIVLPAAQKNSGGPVDAPHAQADHHPVGR